MPSVEKAVSMWASLEFDVVVSGSEALLVKEIGDNGDTFTVLAQFGLSVGMVGDPAREMEDGGKGHVSRHVTEHVRIQALICGHGAGKLGHGIRQWVAPDEATFLERKDVQGVR